MGVEWHIGCTSCKRFLWMGSEKPIKWEGFQMGNEYLERFLALHQHKSDNACELFISSDMHDHGDWDAAPSEWMEDILSRTFWDSYHQQTIRCAACHKVLSDNWRNPPQKGFMRLSRGLWVCDADCRDTYVNTPQEDQDHAIYDSSQDDPNLPADSVLVVGCTQCKEFAAVDGAMDKSLKVRDFEYLASFFEDHVAHRSLKVFFKTPE